MNERRADAKLLVGISFAFLAGNLALLGMTDNSGWLIYWLGTAGAQFGFAIWGLVTAAGASPSNTGWGTKLLAIALALGGPIVSGFSLLSGVFSNAHPC